MPLKVPDLPPVKLEACVQVINEITQALGAEGALPHYRPSRDGAGLPQDLVTAAAAADLGTSKTLAAALATGLIGHGADTDAHSVADVIAIAAWTSAPAEPATLAEVQAVLNEVKGDFNTHLANATPHRALGGAGRLAAVAPIATPDATDQTTANTLANALKTALNAHARAGAQTIQVVSN